MPFNNNRRVPSWDTLAVGDVVITDKSHHRHKVLLDMGNDVFLLSHRNNFEAAGYPFLRGHMKSLGWTVEGAEEKPKVTLTREQAKTLNAMVTEECQYIGGKSNCPTCRKTRDRINSLVAE